MYFIKLLLLVFACTNSEPPTSPAGASSASASEPTPSATPTMQTSTGASVEVQHPQEWKCEESTFIERDRIVATIGGVIVRPQEAGHQLYCSSRSEEHPAAVSIQRFTIGSDLAPEDQFQKDLEDTANAPLAFTTALTPIGTPEAADIAGCHGKRVEHQITALDAERERRHIICTRNGVKYNIVAFGTDGKAWTEAQSILDSLTFK